MHTLHASLPLAVLALAFTPAVRGEMKHGTLAQTLQPFVDARVLAGAVTLVADKDQILDITTVGWADVERKKPMREDTTFWIASMSKAMTAAAVMTLVDEGKLSPDDPVAKHLPEFKEQRVIAENDAKHTLLVPPATAMTVQDTLCHTSGLPFKSAIEQPVLDMVPLRVAVLSHAAAPLIYQPDGRYVYSNAGINTAGRIAEVLSGMSFEQFLDERLLRPLGMTDTTFWPGDDQVARLALSYKPSADKSGIEPVPISQLTYPLQNRARQPMPGGGLFSTARDVARFCQMLLNRGRFGGRRVLSEKAVATMTSRQTPPELKESYGFGLQVRPGEFGHGGAHATNMTVNTSRGLVLVFLVQHTGGWRDDSGKKILPAFQEAAIKAFGQ